MIVLIVLVTLVADAWVMRRTDNRFEPHQAESGRSGSSLLPPGQLETTSRLSSDNHEYHDYHGDHYHWCALGCCCR